MIVLKPLIFVWLWFNTDSAHVPFLRLVPNQSEGRALSINSAANRAALQAKRSAFYGRLVVSRAMICEFNYSSEVLQAVHLTHELIKVAEKSAKLLLEDPENPKKVKDALTAALDVKSAAEITLKAAMLPSYANTDLDY